MKRNKDLKDYQKNYCEARELKSILNQYEKY